MMKKFFCFCLLALPLAAQDSTPEVHENIQITRYLLEVRAYNKQGFQIKDLNREDLAVSHRGKTLPIVSMEWVDPIGVQAWQAEVMQDLLENDEQTPQVALDRGRLIVLYFQATTGEAQRQYRSLAALFQLFVDHLHPYDRVAVFSFDSKLAMHCDFTRDHDRIKKAIYAAGHRQDELNPEDIIGPSISRNFDFETARGAKNSELALKLIAEALKPLKRPSTMAFVGWGMGVSRNGHMAIMPRRYDKTRQAMADADLTVFSLGYKPKHYTYVGGGLRRLAWDNGGEFLSTSGSGVHAVNRLLSSMEGFHLVMLKVAKPLKKPNFRVKLKSGRGHAVFRHASLD